MNTAKLPRPLPVRTRRGRTRTRLFALILMLGILLGFCSPLLSLSVFATWISDGKTVNNTYDYLFTVTAGSVTSKNVLYYEVEYIGKDGFKHSAIILPNSTDGLPTVSALAKDKQTLLNRCHIDKDLETGAGEVSLSALSTVYYPFTVPCLIDTVISINFFCRYDKGSGKNSAGFQSMALYRVSESYGMDMAGYISDDYYLDFDGERIAYTTFSQELNWNGTDTLFRTGIDKYGPYQMHTDNRIEISRSETKRLYFTFDIDDSYGAGYEGLATPASFDKLSQQILTSDEWLFDPLELSFSYTDINGSIVTVDMPVVSSSLIWALNSGGDFGSYSRFIGLYQQGDSICLCIDVPMCGNVDYTTFKLTNNKETALNNGGVSRSDAKDESISVRNFGIYDADTSTAVANCTGGIITPTVSGVPTYTFTPRESYDIGALSSIVIPFEENTGDWWPTSETIDRFLITLKTDKPSAAATSDDIFISFSYNDLNGKSKTTDFFNVREETGKYYGYWPSFSGDDFSFMMGTQPGGLLTFTIQLPEVDRFTGATLKMGDTATDDWQIAEIGIYEMTALGKRSVTWLTGEDDDSGLGIYTDRVFSRDNRMTDISPDWDGPALVCPGEAIMIDFISGGTTRKDNTVDWSQWLYSMSYQDTMQSFGFAKQRCVYEVKVTVSSDLIHGTSNDDCGSRENYYFQLIFENGNSAYVLANQQLSTDGFSTGMVESFTITTNYDYGELTAIRILPEKAGDENEPFDKLKLATISVSRIDNEALAMTWEFAINDWLKIAYNDYSAKTSLRGQPAKTQSQLTDTYLVTAKGYDLKFEVSVGTAGFQDSLFQGKILYTIDYVDNAGVPRNAEGNLIADIYEYAGKTAPYQTYTDSIGKTFEAPVIDYSFMLRENHADRFTVTLHNAASISDIKFTVVATTSGRWNISGVEINMVKTAGILSININDEYQKTDELDYITASTSTTGYSLQFMSNGASNVQPIPLAENKIKVNTSSSWSSSVTRTPKSNDDTVNMYVFMKGGSRQADTYAIKSTLKYMVGNKASQIEIPTYADKSRNMFYALDVHVPGLTTLNLLTIKSDNFDYVTASVDYVIIEHMNSGVLIDTCYYNFGGKTIESDFCFAQPSTDKDKNTYEQEVVFIFSDDTEVVPLVADSQDLAISLRYSSIYSVTSQTLTSPNVFLTDRASNVTKTGASKVVTVKFNVPYLSSISGITFSRLGSATEPIRVLAAYVDTYRTVNGERVFVNRYSMATPVANNIGLAPQTMQVTYNSIDGGLTGNVADVSLDIQLAQDENFAASGLVGMTLAYYDLNGMTKEFTVMDARRYLEDSKFTSGETAHIHMLIKDLASLRYVTLTPHRASATDALASLSIVKIKATVNAGDAVITTARDVSKMVYEDDSVRIGLADVSIKVVAYMSPADDSAAQRRAFISGQTDDVEGILMAQNDSLRLLPTISGSIDSYAVICQRLATSADGHVVTTDVTKAVMTAKESAPETEYSFIPNETGDYRITVYSLETDTVKTVITVTVTEPRAVPEESETVPEETETEGEDLPDPDVTPDNP